MSRPKSVRAHQQVLEAAVKLFSERGIDSTSVDSIAGASGVSKATIYKHWPDKDALCLEAMARVHNLEEKGPIPASGNPRADIVALLNRRWQARSTDLQNRMMPHLISYATRNPSFGKAWRAMVFDPPRARLIELLRQAMRLGQLQATLNLDLAVAMLMGPMMYRKVLSLAKAQLPDDMPERVVDAFWKAHALSGKRRQATAVFLAADPRHPRSYRPADSTSAPGPESPTRRGG
jgi:AcrR family transcriptional regulator